MKIWVTDINGSNPVVLCDHGAGGPDGMEMIHSFSEQVQTFLRSSSARVINRGNALIEIRFAVHREHATLTAAQAFWFDRFTAVHRQGSVIFEFEDRATVRRLALCTVALNMPPPVGVSTREQYTIRGGTGSFLGGGTGQYTPPPILPPPTIVESGTRLLDADGNPLFDSEQNALYSWE
jgi:hypothetical protein